MLLIKGNLLAAPKIENNSNQFKVAGGDMEFKMRQRNGYWQLIELSNFSDYQKSWMLWKNRINKKGLKKPDTLSIGLCCVDFGIYFKYSLSELLTTPVPANILPRIDSKVAPVLP